MFNNCNPITNGEHSFFKCIEKNVNVIFDVGCRTDSEYIHFSGEVHYFDPVTKFIQELKNKKNVNSKSYFNPIGLGKENVSLYYYPLYQSFHDRINACKKSDDKNKILLNIEKGKDYIIKNGVKRIDFLKIDTEGHELDVLHGFEEEIEKIQIIQFEYGGTYLDNNVKLIDVIQYLEKKGFHKFSYLSNTNPVLITDFTDHYKYCNIVCVNKKSDYIPF